jgi:hypothetical protein
VVSGTAASTLGPVTSTGTGVVGPAPAGTVSIQQALVQESILALERGLIRSSFMTLATALEVAAARAIERVGRTEQRFRGLADAIRVLSPRISADQREVLDRLRRIRNELTHEARFDFTEEQTRSLHVAFREAIAMLDALS